VLNELKSRLYAILKISGPKRIKDLEALIREYDQKESELWANLLTGYRFLFTKEYAHSLISFESATEEEKTEIFAWNGLGYTCVRMRNYSRARECFNKVISIDKNFALAWNGIGVLFKQEKDYKKAKECYQKAIALDENYAIPWFNLGVLFRQEKDYEKAKECYQKVIALDENYASSWNNLGVLFKQEKDYEKAKECYQKAIALDENNARPWNNLGVLFEQEKNYEKAKECYQKAIALDENNARPWNNLGVLFEREKDYEKAKEYYQKAIVLDENYAIAWNNLGILFQREKDYEKAKECYQKAIVLDDNYAIAWNNLGVLFQREKDYEKAKECYQKAIALDENYAFPWFNLGLVFQEQNNYEKAKEYCKKATELNGNYAAPWVTLGNIYRKEGKPALAEDSYKKAINIDSNIGYPQLNYGLLMLEDGRKNEALLLLSTALNIFNDTKNEYMQSITQHYITNLKSDLESAQKLQESIAEGKTYPELQILKETNDLGIDAEIQNNKKMFLSFVEEGKVKESDDSQIYLEVLRRWNSFTPIVSNSHLSKGGGYFVKIGSKGVVIDPGFNFIDNYRGMGHFFSEIDIILVSHAHNDHTADLESIITLLHKYNSEIKESEDNEKENTIKRQIAERNEMSVEKVSKDLVENEFIKSGRRKIIDIYLTKSVFKKFCGLFEISSRVDYKIHIIEHDQEILLDNFKLKIIRAKHDDIISDNDSVGFVLKIGNTTIIYTGDTGWNGEMEKCYANLKDFIKGTYVVLLAHIGGFKAHEMGYLRNPKDDKVFYKNHLGRLGLAKINLTIRPNLCLISEFGEELMGNRSKIAQIYNDSLADIIFLPVDIGFKYDIERNAVAAVSKVDSKRELVYQYTDPSNVLSDELIDYTILYYDRNQVNQVKKEEILQIVAKR
jgi:tetratricopeptide (TPR) repeat protein